MSRMARFRLRTPWRRGFTVRLAMSTSLLIVAACVTLSWIIVRQDLEEIDRSLIERGRTIAQYLARDAELSALTGNVQELQLLARSVRVQRDVAYCAFLDGTGRSLVLDGTRPVNVDRPPTTIGTTAELVVVDPDTWEFQAEIVTTDTRPQREELEFGDTVTATAAARGTQHRIGTAVLGVSLVPLRELRHRMFVTAGLVAALVTVLAVLSATLLARTMTRPLRELAKATDAIARGELNTTVAISTEDEVGALATSFNTMAQSVANGRAALESYSRTLEEKVQARTERLEELNRELEEANRLKSEFVATVSHELRTPLNVIIGYCDMLLTGAGGPVSEEQRPMLDAIKRYSHQQFDLVNNVLDFSRLASGKVSLQVERFALRPLLVDVCAAYQPRLAAAGIRLVVATAADVPELATDRIKLQEIVRNLIDNAVKHTAAGSITVEAGIEPASGALRLEVKDTGCGVPAEALPYIFEPFHQATVGTYGGVGLGLSIVKQLAAFLGGRVSVASRVGEGSTFRVEIPPRLDSPKTDGGVIVAGHRR